MATAVKKVSTDFYLKVDTDYDLFGAAGASNFECWYIKDGELNWTQVINPFTEIIEPIITPVTDTVTNAIVNAGASYIPVTADPTLQKGNVFKVDGSGTKATGTLTDSTPITPLTLNITMQENLGDQGNITITIIETGSITIDNAVGTWNEVARTLIIDIANGVTTDTTIRTELLTFTTLIYSVSAATTAVWNLADAINGDDFNMVGGIDPQMYYVESVNNTTDRIYIRGLTTAQIPANSTLTQVGNSGVYRVMLNIGTVGDYTIICRNSLIGMQNIAQSVEIVPYIMSDAVAKIDTIDTVVDGIATTISGMDTQIDGMDTQLDTIEGKVDSVQAALGVSRTYYHGFV